MSLRVICWYSHGAASAVAVDIAIKKYGLDRVLPVYCNTARNEHSDNARFRNDCEKWWGKKVTIIGSENFTTVENVFEKTRYMAGPKGARCTTELKKIPRFKFQLPDDTHVFGFTSDKKELKRIRLFEANNAADMRLDWVLRDAGITKKRCYQILQEAGIALPQMYLLGYRNNNCLGCVKSTSPGYWQKVWLDFPEVFRRRAVQSRLLGVRLVELHKKRIFLDDLEALLIAGERFPYKGEDLSCGPECKG